MGTMIELSLNGTPIDYGKNHYWTSHAWLFPPNSEQQHPYVYACDTENERQSENEPPRTWIARHPALVAPLEQVRRRMNLMGYSLNETRSAYDAILGRWNRTHDLRLSFDHYLDVVTRVDFTTITEQDQFDFGYDIRNHLLRLFEVSAPQNEDAPNFWNRTFSGDEDGHANRTGNLEDFLLERLPAHIMIRCMADRPGNLTLPLAWCYHDLVDSGWETKETLLEIDRNEYVLNLIRLYGRLQDYSGHSKIARFDDWLFKHDVPRETKYIRALEGRTKEESLTLPTAVRHMIHHPENRNQILTDTQLQEAVEELVTVALAVDLA